MTDISAFVLAGGRSSRMGSNKALLPIGNETLLQRALRTAIHALGNACIVGARSVYDRFGEVVEDVYTGCGPLGGIHAALRATTTDLNLMLSVDMPLMTPQFLRWLGARARKANALIVIPNATGGPQPLCAIYRKDVLETAEQALKRGDYKIGSMFSKVPTLLIQESELSADGFSPDIFQNINTQEDYRNLCQHIEAGDSKEIANR